jgi:TetR/AcrR family transcriptional regulator, regulator of cefoperazone and chloramphenicol sensitivity
MPLMDTNTHKLIPPERPSALRSDGQRSREQLMMVALRLFAEHGYEKTSTRQICSQAGVNIAQIAYHFGDKAGLYRAVFTEPMGSPAADIPLFSDPAFTLKQALQGLYSGFIEPLKQGDIVRTCVRLHMREMVEPTGLWSHEIDHGIKPYHAALVKVLMRHLKLKREDDDVCRLTFSIIALGVHLYVGRDVMERVTPQLMASDKAMDVMHERLVSFALAMVGAEKLRRKKKTV